MTRVFVEREVLHQLARRAMDRKDGRAGGEVISAGMTIKVLDAARRIVEATATAYVEAEVVTLHE